MCELQIKSITDKCSTRQWDTNINSILTAFFEASPVTQSVNKSLQVRGEFSVFKQPLYCIFLM